MYITKKFIFTALVFLSSQTFASAVTLDLTTETNGSLGSSIQREAGGINVDISAYFYNDTTNEITSAVVVGIDGVTNVKHPAGIGIGKSATSINPPGIDNVSGNSSDHVHSEFLVFSFDSSVDSLLIETEGLGPHGTDVEFWKGSTALNNPSDITELGEKLIVNETAPGFSPTNAEFTWFAISAKPEEDFNVFSIQSIQFSEATPTTVPVPAAFWLFLTGVVGLARKRHIGASIK
jgi:hypothetical protein